MRVKGGRWEEKRRVVIQRKEGAWFKKREGLISRERVWVEERYSESKIDVWAIKNAGLQGGEFGNANFNVGFGRQ